METRVWLSSKKQRGGSKRYYYLRWVDPAEKVWRSQAIKVNGRPCTDKKRAEKEAAKLESKLQEGTYRHVRKSTWDGFKDHVVGGISGEAHRAKMTYTLDLFAEHFPGVIPANVSYAVLRDFASKLREKKLKPASINGVFRYMRLAMFEAVALGYVASHPMTRRWRWEPEDTRPIREVSKDEQKALEKAARRLYGPRWAAFLTVAVGSGARRGELLTLSWDDVDLDQNAVQIVTSKTHQPRLIPLGPDAIAALRRLRRNVVAVRSGGPFKGMDDNLGRQWGRIRTAAELADVKLHDLRRTYISRLIRAGVALPLVSKLAGNGIGVIMDYYNAVGTDADKREAVARLG